MPTQLPVTEIRVQQHAATESDVSVVSPQLPATDEAASPSAHILVLSWVALIAAVITYAWWQYLRDVMHNLSAVGPAFKLIMQEWHTRAGLTTVWRNQAMALLMFPPALIEYERTPVLERASWWSASITDDLTHNQVEPPRQRHIVVYLIAICFLGTGSLFMWVQSLAFTTTVRASLFSSMYPIILMLYFRFFKGVRHSTGELVGVAVAVSGIAMALLDPTLTSSNSPGGYSAIVGDFMAFLSAVLLAINIMLAKYVRKILPVFSYVWATMFVRIFILSFYSCVAEGSDVSFDVNTGIFGWINPSRTRPVMLFAAAAGYFGILGWNFCLKHIDAVVFSTVGLADPVLTGYIAWFIGLEDIPQTWTIIGGTVVLGGIVLTVVYEHRRSKAEELEKKLQLEIEARSLPLPPAELTLAQVMEEYAMHDFSHPERPTTSTTHF